MNYTDIDQLLEESIYTGIDPFTLLLEESKKLKEVHSDDDPSVDQMDKQDNNSSKGSKKETLSDEEIQQVAQALQTGQITEDQLKEAVQKGQISEEDFQKIAALLQQGQPNPEDLTTQQINQLQDMVIRFSIMEKLNTLEEKIEHFLDFFQNVDDPIYKRTQDIFNYIKIINTLIFQLEINLLYQLYVQIEMQLIDVFNDYKMRNQ